MGSPGALVASAAGAKQSTGGGQAEHSLKPRTEQQRLAAELVWLHAGEVVHWSPLLDDLDAALVRKAVPLAIHRARGEEPPDEPLPELPLSSRPGLEGWAQTFEGWRRERDRRQPLYKCPPASSLDPLKTADDVKRDLWHAWRLLGADDRARFLRKVATPERRAS